MAWDQEMRPRRVQRRAWLQNIGRPGDRHREDQRSKDQRSVGEAAVRTLTIARQVAQVQAGRRYLSHGGLVFFLLSSHQGQVMQRGSWLGEVKSIGREEEE